MRRHFALATIASTLVLAACGGDDAAEQSRVQDSIAADSANQPRNAAVTSIEFGLATDSTGRITGGSQENFPAPDTLYVSVRTRYVAEHAPIMVRLSKANAVIDSVSIMSGAPDETDTARSLATFPGAASLEMGVYQIEVLLEGVSQGIREVRFGVP
jgi:hypothetical protein